jgi:hypothetical protein
MIIGRKSFFTREHFEKHRENADRYLIELVVYCLEFVSLLAGAKLKFRFKGGNSLLIVTQKPGRFSIDVDIATAEPREKLIEKVLQVTDESDVFIRCEVRQHKTKPWLPMISFNIYFDSVYTDLKDSFIMLDAVLHQAPYAGELKQVKCGEIYFSESQVEVSTPEGLMGDKILTLGPATLGIPLGKNKEGQRLKHVFDISTLFSLNEQVDFGIVGESVAGCLQQENQLQRFAYTFSQVKEDTLAFCQAPFQYKSPPPLSDLISGTNLYEIVKGFFDLQGFVLQKEYGWGSLLADLHVVVEVLDQIKL